MIIIITIIFILLSIIYAELRFVLPVYLFYLCVKFRKHISLNSWTIIGSMVVIYWKNFLFTYYLLSIPKFVIIDKKDNYAIQKHVYRMFSNVFNLQISGTRVNKSPTIYVANYPCNFVECFASMLIPDNIAIVMGDNIGTRSTWALFLSDIVYRKKKFGNSYGDVKKQIACKIADNKSILAYTTSHGLKGEKGIYLGRVRTGLFRIAQELGVSITPVVFDTITHDYGRILQQNYQIRICDSFTVSDPEVDALKVKNIFRDTLRTFNL